MGIRDPSLVVPTHPFLPTFFILFVRCWLPLFFHFVLPLVASSLLSRAFSNLFTHSHSHATSIAIKSTTTNRKTFYTVLTERTPSENKKQPCLPSQHRKSESSRRVRDVSPSLQHLFQWTLDAKVTSIVVRSARKHVSHLLGLNDEYAAG